MQRYSPERGGISHVGENFPGASAVLSVDESLALHPIFIRLPRNLIESLKLIAAHHKVAYQPLVRDLLTRFAKSEMQLIMREMVDAQEKSNTEEAGIVNEFIEREMARKRA